MIRPVAAADLPALKAVIDGVGLFPSEMLDGMVEGHLAAQAGEDIWLTADEDGPVAVLFCAPERMTQGTWNNLLLAVHPSRHGRGVGASLLAHVEAVLRERGAHLLLVETSALPAFERTRRFYRFRGYEEEARIRDFYGPGDDKVVFRKAL